MTEYQNTMRNAQIAQAMGNWKEANALLERAAEMADDEEDMEAAYRMEAMYNDMPLYEDERY